MRSRNYNAIRRNKFDYRPAIALPNTMAETREYWELLNSAYGRGRQTGSYRPIDVGY